MWKWYHPENLGVAKTMIDPEQLTFVQLFWLVFAVVMIVFCFSWWLDSVWQFHPIR